MFLTFLSATLIVIGFLIGAQGLSTALIPVVAILLLADLYIGAATVGRLFDANREELLAIRGMNRIRHAYLEMVPGLEPYFVTSPYDDAAGILATYGEPDRDREPRAERRPRPDHGDRDGRDASRRCSFGALAGLPAPSAWAPAAGGRHARGGRPASCIGVATRSRSAAMRWAMTEDSRGEARFPRRRRRA